MPDTPWKSMGKDRDSRREEERWAEANGPLAWVACEKCGGDVFTGDWPYCSGSPTDHSRE